MRSLGWALTQYHWCPYKKGAFGHRDTQGGGHVEMKADTGLTHLQAKKRQRFQANHQQLGDRPERDPPSQPGGANTADTATSGVAPPDWDTRTSATEMPRVWRLVRHPSALTQSQNQLPLGPRQSLGSRYSTRTENNQGRHRGTTETRVCLSSDAEGVPLVPSTAPPPAPTRGQSPR